MQFLQFILIGVSLAMDAFAICLCQGMFCKKGKVSLGLKLGVTFGFFQFLMPWIGYNVGNIFSDKVSTYGNIVAFIILLLIGINMIRETGEDESCSAINDLKTLFILGIATSIDALAIGLSFSMTGVENIYFSGIIIGIVTFIISFLGTILGNNIGQILGGKAHFLGGGILIVLGFKILLENFI